VLLSLLGVSLAAEPAPSELPAAVRVEGPVTRVELLGAEGEFEVPSEELPAGRYLILATWAQGPPFVAGRVTVAAGELLTLRCDEAFAVCLPERREPTAEGWEGRAECPEGPARVQVEGDGRRMALVREGQEGGSVLNAGKSVELPAGTYRIWTEWDQTPELSGIVELRAGEQVTVRCSEAFQLCRAVETRCRG
jgi:hypothetical protein